MLSPETMENIKSLRETVGILSEDFSQLDTDGIRKFAVAKNFISNAFVRIDGDGGKELFVYFRKKEEKFRPKLSQGSGLNCTTFMAEATDRGLTAGKDYFLEKTHFTDFLKSVREQLKGEIVSLETASDVDDGEKQNQQTVDVEGDTGAGTEHGLSNSGGTAEKDAVDLPEDETKDEDGENDKKDCKTNPTGKDSTPITETRKKIQLEGEQKVKDKYCIVRLKNYQGANGEKLECTSKATFGFAGDSEDKAFVCRNHSKAEFHSLYKGEFSYAPEQLMPKLAHIHKASAGPPTVHVEGIVQTSAQRQKRFRGDVIVTGGNERLNTSTPVLPTHACNTEVELNALKQQLIFFQGEYDKLVNENVVHLVYAKAEASFAKDNSVLLERPLTCSFGHSGVIPSAAT